jgi:hypothetical protein
MYSYEQFNYFFKVDHDNTFPDPLLLNTLIGCGSLRVRILTDIDY